MRSEEMKVGELAKATGISVRTLHYYEEIGLVEPPRQTSSGHRLYGAAEVARLQQILSLRQLGFSLEEVRGCLERRDLSPLRVIELHLDRLRGHLEVTRRLEARLERIAERLRTAEEVSVEDLLQTIEDTLMLEKYYTPEQMKKLEARREEVGEERIRQGEQQWQELFERFRVEMEKGTDPASETVQALLRRSRELVEEFTGGDPGIADSLRRMYRDHPDAPNQFGMSVDPAVFDYMRRAGEAGKEPS